MNTAEKIRRERKKAGLSQEALSEELGVSRQAITKWENGSAVPETDKIVLLSEFFSVTTDYLLKDYIEEPAALPPAGQAGKEKRSWRLMLGVPMLLLFLLVWGVVWYLSTEYPTGVLNWDGSSITGFWGFLEFHNYRTPFLGVALLGMVGLLLIGVEVFIRKQYKKALLLWLRKKSWGKLP